MNEEILENSSPVPENDEKIDTTGVENSEKDYEALIEEDLAALRNSIPELEAIKDIGELENPIRYGALRDLGLSPEEAYRATTIGKRARPDNRAHLISSAPRAIHTESADMSYRELEMAREIFAGIPDTEIQRLYKKVTR